MQVLKWIVIILFLIAPLVFMTGYALIILVASYQGRKEGKKIGEQILKDSETDADKWKKTK